MASGCDGFDLLVAADEPAIGDAGRMLQGYAGMVDWVVADLSTSEGSTSCWSARGTSRSMGCLPTPAAAWAEAPGFMPGTYQAVYNGTKAFLDMFSYALRAGGRRM